MLITTQAAGFALRMLTMWPGEMAAGANGGHMLEAQGIATSVHPPPNETWSCSQSQSLLLSGVYAESWALVGEAWLRFLWLLGLRFSLLGLVLPT